MDEPDFAAENDDIDPFQGLDDIFLSDENGGEFDVEDTEGFPNHVGGCNFDAATGVNGVDDLWKINMTDLSVANLMRFHFSDLRAAFLFYNHYASTQGFSARKGKTMSTSSIGGVMEELEYENQSCFCGINAAIKVSNTERNKRKLFYTCDKRSCTFFKWCHPISREIRSRSTMPNEVDAEDMNMVSMKTEINAVKDRVQALEHFHALMKFGVFAFAILMFFYFDITV